MPISDIVTTRVKRQVSIGSNVAIVCGVTIGKVALTTTWAVVAKDAPDSAVVVASPAQMARDVHTKAIAKKTEALSGVVKEILGDCPPRQKTKRLTPARERSRMASSGSAWSS